MLIIDRIEDGIAVIENDSERLEIPICDLPLGAKEGNIIAKTESGFVILSDETELRRSKLRSAVDKVLKGWLK